MTEDSSSPVDDPTDPVHPATTTDGVSEAAIRRLAEAVAQLSNDSDYFLRELTDMLLAMKPVSKEKLSENEVRFLIESGAFTADEWTEASESVNRGSLQLSAAEGWLSGLFETASMETTAGFLGWNEGDVRAAVSEGRLYAIEISGRFRFPTWQFDAGSPLKLLPGLTRVIELVAPRWHWQSTAGFMSTPQRSLVAEGRKTPTQWLRDGGDIEHIQELVETSDWS